MTRGLCFPVIAIGLAACSGSPGDAPTTPVITSFTAEPAVIEPGASSTLKWSATGATSFAVTGIGYFTDTRVTVTPFQTTTYELAATGAGGSGAARVTVRVNSSPNGPAIFGFAALPRAVSSGGSALLSWTVVGATSIAISGIGVVTGTTAAVSPATTTAYVLAARGANGTSTESLMVWADPMTDPAILHDVADEVSRDRLRQLVAETSGATPVSLNGESVSITERFSPEGKARFRAYWNQYFDALGLAVTTIEYPTAHAKVTGETTGHNLEVVMPGQSRDTVVLITHYDSTGSAGMQTSNPGADDNMTGMAQIFEAARILKKYQGRLRHTVRFVAADYEEDGTDIEGATQYANYLRNLALAQGFAIVAAIDPEQSGWNCASEAKCSAEVGGHELEVTACDVEIGVPAGFPLFDFRALEDQFDALSKELSSLTVFRQCNGNISDHFPFAGMNIPAVFYGERLPFMNPHRDQSGDTLDIIDLDYLTEIARVGIAVAAQVIGISDP